MAVSLTNPSDIINDALVRIGYKHRIGSVYDGSPASKASLDIYSQTRDALLCQDDWGFAERDIALTLLKTAPVGGYNGVWNSTYPILPWIYEYGYPDDCLKVRSLRKTPTLIPEFDPRAVNFRIANDASLSPPAQVILTNLANPVCVYTGKVTDPATWTSGFIEALAAELGRRLAPLLAGLEMAKAETQDEAVEVSQAMMERG